ncbi:MAG: Asp-tRNA(Asn)/Glu-tRNA(Gln) amidotransferase subunit GatC [Firmicutes bacterium]|jgi:aspartyl-tRNA(Asn)/glutamyl-tRNA(Gln) amidotransferase subunit C|nr:Asp-tRNA(Asn)/Glu-tRNA(Gln) amidotransferase subunit GatC [Bacillota bacterium]
MVVSELGYTVDDAKLLADRAKLRFSREQLEKATQELNDMIRYVDQLAHVDTEGVPPMSHPHSFANVWRDDEPKEGLSAEDALANAPDRHGQFFRVPRIIAGEEEG